jgi:hypothetical protein
VSKPNRYRCVVQWTHKKWGPKSEKVASEATSIRRAINAALLSFFSNSSTRNERRDAHASLTVQCWRVKKPTAA